ncbi:MAG: 3-isopropylmalate dehydratase small subunit [Candidatus Coatesbacteria bacterium RBG_13_66_14]|uniref:3-isopropylmalate dehydratase small subunit n=1 Tax=Candidatus Coatesbacteria bacterium RBG_13_66_14 TaxID=1817816 RepID=A0A1F5FHE1_9BACT|nr:MAG: 3-isopropylmalate dehydratase small subunit [Candidatus Coatesbacteria bacterium RBG_13_66_14]
MFRGRVWVVGDDIDTDQIYHGQYLPLTDPSEMAAHALEFVPGKEGFVAQVKAGDILVTGKNFGCGSSREHAVLCLKHAGVACIVAESFSRIFYRNAVNLGYPVLECPGIVSAVAEGDEVEVDTDSGEVTDLVTGKGAIGVPLSDVEAEISRAGGLLEYIRTRQP